MTVKTVQERNKERQQAFRQRKAAESLAEVRGVFAPIEQHAAIKEAIAKLLKNATRAI